MEERGGPTAEQVSTALLPVACVIEIRKASMLPLEEPKQTILDKIFNFLITRPPKLQENPSKLQQKISIL